MESTITASEDLEMLRNHLPADEIKDSASFMTFADAVSRTELGETLLKGKGIILARAQTDMFALMFHFAQLLHQGRIGGGGTTGRSIFGAKGIGKTHAARAFVALVECIWDDVYAIYISAHDFPELCRTNNSLLGWVIDELNKARNLECPRYDLRSRVPQSPLKLLCGALYKKKKRLFLFVDEIDQTYRNNDVYFIYHMLRHLALIGDSLDSEVAAMLCSSSAFLTELIRGRCSESMRSTYRLFEKGSINLNATKFFPKRVYSNLPTDLVTATEIASVELNSRDIKKVRALAFMSGSNVRCVQNLARDNDGQSESAKGQDSIAYGLDALEHSEKLLLLAIYSELARLNQQLFSELSANDLLESIQTVEWERKFIPLSWEQVEVLYSSMQNDHPGLKPMRLAEIMLHLSDRSRVVLDGVQDGHARRVFPITIFILWRHVYDATLAPELLDAFKKSVLDFVVGAKF